MDPFTEQRKKLEHEILEIVVSSLEQNRLTTEEPQQIATFVLDRIDNLKNQEHVVSFLTELATKWPIFSSLLEMEKGQVERKQEEQAANQVAQLIKMGRTKQALQMADSAIGENQ